MWGSSVENRSREKIEAGQGSRQNRGNEEVCQDAREVVLGVGILRSIRHCPPFIYEMELEKDKRTRDDGGGA